MADRRIINFLKNFFFEGKSAHLLGLW